MLTEVQQRYAVEKARTVYQGIWPEVDERGACMFHALTLQIVLARTFGVRTMLQAGSCSWPMIRPEDDDGERATHYSYRWNGMEDPETAAYFAAGKLPECHVWLATREPEDTIIDPTTGTWPARAKRGGHDWSAIEPPEFLWATQADLRALSEVRGYVVRYAAVVEACIAVDILAQVEIYPKLARWAKESR